MSGPKFLGEGLPYIESEAWGGWLIAIEGCDGVGRTTQLKMLREWLELQGFGVVETEWTSESLIEESIPDAQAGRPMDPLTYSLLWATDFADRLEKVIIPALRNGFVVLSDRYVFTALARNAVRGADPQWVRDLFGFSLLPDLVLYLQIDVNSLARRVLRKGRINAVEAGLDLRLGDDRYECFKRYQTRLIREFNRLADEFNFLTINARRSAELTQKEVRQVMARFVERRQREKAAKQKSATKKSGSKRSASKAKSKNKSRT